MGGVRRRWPRPRGKCLVIRLPSRQYDGQMATVEPATCRAEPCTCADGQWINTYLRVGEAANPGPGPEARRCAWGAFAAQQPHVGGFRHAWAPGFDSACDGDQVTGMDKAQFALSIVTVNVTGWGSLVRYLRKASADVLLVQELRVGPASVDDKVAWLRRRGWNAVVAAATQGPNGGWCGGVAVIARPHVGMSLPRVGSDVVLDGRVAAAWLEPPGSRPFLALSCYMIDGLGLAKGNLEILRLIGNFVAAQGDECPFVLGGDMQVTPQELAGTGFAGTASAVIAASLDPSGTCKTATSARELDFFVVSKGLAVGIDHVRVVPRSGIKTHVPVALTFKPCLASIRALIIRQPPRLETERIVGPLRKVADWSWLAEEARRLCTHAADDAYDAGELHARLGRLYTEWADMAEKDMMECVVDGQHMPKLGTRGRAPVLVWRSILPERTTKGDDVHANWWRNVANAALSLSRLAMDSERLRRPAADAPLAAHDDAEPLAAVGDDDVDGEDAEDVGDAVVWDMDWEKWERQVADAIDDARELRAELDEVEHGEGPAEDGVSRDPETVDLLFDMLTRLLRARGMEEELAARISGLRACVAARSDAIAERFKRKHEAEWAAWLRKGIDSGARNAHMFLRLPTQWRPRPMIAPDGVLSADPARMTAAYRAKYIGRWNGQAGEEAAAAPRTHAPWLQARRCALPKPSVPEIRSASRAFSHGTAVAFDGIAMRHYALVTDEGLSVLADLLHSMELIGRPPRSWRPSLCRSSARSGGGTAR